MNFPDIQEIEIVPSTSEKCVIPKLKKIFSTREIPVIIKSDNGPPLMAQK